MGPVGPDNFLQLVFSRLHLRFRCVKILVLNAVDRENVPAQVDSFDDGEE
jgi:hypothetical protein